MMIPLLMGIIVAAYIAGFLYTASRLANQLMIESEEKVTIADQSFREAVRRKDSLFVKKMELEEEAFKAFTLYEITKEITKSLSEKEAFEIFKLKLGEHVQFTECLLIDESQQDPKALSSDGYFLFPLEVRERKIGVLALKGISEIEYEKVAILGHQFALALRRVHLYQEVGRVAITDSLTEVHTRRYIETRLEEELARCKARKLKMSFMMIDADNFKLFNDRYGHLTGDQVLRNIGRIIKENIREIDIAGRYGGEEFCVVLPETDVEGAKYAAERIREACERAVIKAYDAKINVTLSIGIATFPDHAKNMGEIIDKADWALYRSKKRGRNMVSAFGMFESGST